jgi:predicted nucleotidyltransferase
MRHKFSGDIVNSTNAQRVLSFLVDTLNREFLASEIQKTTGLSKAGVYRALSELAGQKLIKKHKRGRFVLYSAIADDCIVRQFKVLKTTIFLKKLIPKLKPLSRKIIFFGSGSRGEDYKDSDLDLLIISKDPDVTEKIISSFKSKRKIQPVIKTPTQMVQLEEKNKEFFNEINSGIILWEERDED